MLLFGGLDAMSLIKRINTVRNETYISKAVPITHLNKASVFETSSGGMGSVLKVEGIPFVTEENEQLNRLNAQWHQALTSLDSRFIQYVTVHRRKENLELNGEYHSYFGKRVNDKYHQRFQNKSLFINDIYLTSFLKSEQTSNKSFNAISKLLSKLNSKEQRVLARDANIGMLESKVNQLVSLLDAYKPEILGCKDKIKSKSELLPFLSLFLNANKDVQFQTPHFNAPIASSISETFKEESIYPMGNLSQYLAQKRIFFGDYIQFQGNAKDDVKFGAMLSIKKYGRETAHVVLDPLYELDVEFILTHSFAPLSRDKALSEISLKRDKLINAEDMGASQIEELSCLEDEIASEQSLLGFHHNSLLLLADSKEELEQALIKATTVYANAGIVVVKETLNQEACFLAQIPGNHHFITRASLITTHNFTDFCSLHNYQTGFKDENHLRGAVTVLETSSKTPIYFNYHARGGDKVNPAPGHAAIYGATNAGKNTLVSFLDAQMGRFNNRTFFLDRDRAQQIYVSAYENSSYTVISPKNTTLAMNPFQLSDTPENRTFLKNFLAELVKKPGEVDVPVDVRELLNESVNYAYEVLDKPFRQLSHITKNLPLNFPRWPELRQFLKGDENREAGEFGWIFDNDMDSLNLNFDKVGFDVTYLMDKVSTLISTPVYMYLLHIMSQMLDGRLTTFVIDEAWQVFASSFWLKVLGTWVPTIRKLNGHFVFMTQSAETVIQSTIAHIINDNVVTKVIFPNSDALWKSYQKLGVSHAEFEVIKNTNPLSRQFLYKSKNEHSILCRLDLSDLKEELRVFSGNEKTVNLFNDIVREHGLEPKHWLPVFFERSVV